MSIDWGGLRAIHQEAIALHDLEWSRPLLTCPNDGTPLQIRPDGLKDCPMGDFTSYAQTWGEIYDGSA